MKPNRAVPALAFALCLAAPAALLARPPAPARPAADDPAEHDAAAAALRLALVNGEAITLADLRAAFAARHSGHGTLLSGRGVLERVLDKAIDERLLIQEARSMGLAEEAAFVEAVEAYRDLVRLEALEERFVRAPAEPAAEEVRVAYALLPRQQRLAVLDTADRAAAAAALEAIAKGEPFDAVARRVSTHSSRTRGGDLGMITWGQLDPRTERVAFATAAGATAGPFAVEGGFRVLKVIEEKQGSPPPFDNVEARIRAILRERRRESLRADLLAAIRRAHPPVEDASALTRLVYGPRQPRGQADPPDDAVLLRTATGLTLTAGRVRQRAQNAGIAPSEAWRLAAEDALLIDEARRRIRMDAPLAGRVRRFAEARLRETIEGTVILKDLTLEDGEVRAFYDRNPALFAGRPAYHLRHIVVPEAAAAEEIRAGVLRGGDFAALARKRSIDAATAARGGDLGWVDVPEDGAAGQVAAAVFALKAGEVSPVLRADGGFAVVQVLAVRPALSPPYEKARHDAAQRLMIRKQQERRDAFVAKLRGRAAVRTFPAALARAVAMQDAAARGRLAAAAPDGSR